MAYMVNREAPMSGLSNLLALRGRMGDTELVHMSKPEIRMLGRMGELTSNPRTGLPEAFSLEDEIAGLSGLVSNYSTGKEAMQQLMDYGLNKLMKFEAPPPAPVEVPSMPMPQSMAMPLPELPMEMEGGLTAALSAGRRAKDTFEGRVQGKGDGMDDEIDFDVVGDPVIKKAKLSADEYVVAADVVSALGNGSSDAGADKLDQFMKDVREDAHGKTTQQKEVNENKLFRELNNV